MHSTHLKCWLILPNLSPKKLEPIYTSTKNAYKCLFPNNLLDNFYYLILENCQCDGEGIHFIAPIFISSTIREVDHLFECFSGPCIFIPVDLKKFFLFMVVNLSLPYFFPSEACLSILFAMHFTIKSVKPQTAYLFHYGFWVSFATYKVFIPIKYPSMAFSNIFMVCVFIFKFYYNWNLFWWEKYESIFTFFPNGQPVAHIIH